MGNEKKRRFFLGFLPPKTVTTRRFFVKTVLYSKKNKEKLKSRGL